MHHKHEDVHCFEHFSCMFALFWGVAMFSYPVGGQLFLKQHLWRCLDRPSGHTQSETQSEIRLSKVLMIFSLRSCRSSLVIFDFCRKFGGKYGGNFAGLFLTHRMKAQTFCGKFQSIFRKKIRSSKKIFHAEFSLHTCHLNMIDQAEIQWLMLKEMWVNLWPAPYLCFFSACNHRAHLQSRSAARESVPDLVLFLCAPFTRSFPMEPFFRNFTGAICAY